MTVFELRIKVYLTENITTRELPTKITALMDQALIGSIEMSKLHEKNRYKFYSYDRLYPLEQDKIYKKDQIYFFTVRTIDPALARYLADTIPQVSTREIKALKCDPKKIPQHLIDTLYTLTPVILKNDFGYWRAAMSLKEFEKRLRINLIKKYNSYTGERMQEDFELYNRLEFLNSKPIPIQYKNIVLLGDKIKLEIAENPTAQLLAYMAIGTGLAENNGRGAGFVNYQWIK